MEHEKLQKAHIVRHIIINGQIIFFLFKLREKK